MPQLSQGDVFVSVDTSRAELAVVFGHIGFNEMHQRWAAFSARQPQLAGVRDPRAVTRSHATRSSRCATRQLRAQALERPGPRNSGL